MGEHPMPSAWWIERVADAILEGADDLTDAVDDNARMLAFRVWEALPLASKPDGCSYDAVSSRVCERGTKCCTIKHGEGGDQ